MKHLEITSVATTKCLDGKSILITGGTGSFGRAFVQRALESRAKKIIEQWAHYRPMFRKVMPVEYRRALMEMEQERMMVAAE